MATRYEKDRPLGRRYAADPRDRFFTVKALAKAAGTPITLKARSRPWTMGPVLDQESTGPTCVDHANQAIVEAAPHMQYVDQSHAGIMERYHRQQAYDEIPGTNYDGTTQRGAFKVYRELGYYAGGIWLTTPQELRQWVRSTSLVSAGMDWFTGFDKPDSKGYVNLKGEWRGGHQIVIRWYYPNLDAYLIRNSWGPLFKGPRIGEALVRAPELDYLLFQAGGDAFGPIEVKNLKLSTAIVNLRSMLAAEGKLKK